MTGNCGPGATIRSIAQNGSRVNCVAAVQSVAAGAGLTGGGGPGDVTIGADTSFLQRRITSGCSGNDAIQSVDADGTVTCQGTGTGTVVSVGSDFGLTGGPITTSGSLAADPAVLQQRISGSCSGNNAVQSVAQGGAVGCNPFVTGVTAGSGLSGGTITDSGTIAVDASATQSRVSGTCSGGQAVQSVNQNGSVGCSSSFAPAASVLTPGFTPLTNGASATLFTANGVSLIGDCSDGVNAKFTVATNGTVVNALVISSVASAPGASGVLLLANQSSGLLSTTGTDRGEFNAGLTGGAMVSASYAASKRAGGCDFIASGVASG